MVHDDAAGDCASANFAMWCSIAIVKAGEVLKVKFEGMLLLGIGCRAKSIDCTSTLKL